MAEFHQLLTLTVLLLIIISLFKGFFEPAITFLSGTILLLIFQIITPEQFLSGFSNKQILTIVLLILISAGLRKNFNISLLFDRLFSKATSPRSFLFIMMSFVAGCSAFINNTPMVAMMTPYVYDWGKRNGVYPSKLLIPLSFATILGGMITIVGTSTNLVLNGFLEQSNERLLDYSDFLYLGLLVTVFGVLFILAIGSRLLPENKDRIEMLKKKPREYLVETRIGKNSPLLNKTVSDGGLRNLNGVYLVELVRGEDIISPVGPNEKLKVNDRLIFAGDTEKIVDLLSEDKGFYVPKADSHLIQNNLDITEVVIPANSSLAGQLVKDTDFRSKYNAAIIAIHRNGEKLSGKIGNMRLTVGDLLLLSIGKEFHKQNESLKGLYEISKVRESRPDSRLKRNIFKVILIGIITLILGGMLELFLGLLIIFTSLVILGLFQVEDIRKDLDFNLITILVCALVLGDALIDTGTADLFSQALFSVLKPTGNLGLLIGLFFLTILLTSFITNAAAVSIVFPIAYTLCQDLAIDGKPFYVAIAFGASAAFLTPMGYQTNLMVYGPGGYNFRDYFRIGLPLTILYSAVCIVFIVLRYNLN